jgi:hypothetical protein
MWAIVLFRVSGSRRWYGSEEATEQCLIHEKEEDEDKEHAKDTNQRAVMYTIMKDTAAQDAEYKIQQETAHPHSPSLSGGLTLGANRGPGDNTG